MVLSIKFYRNISYTEHLRCLAVAVRLHQETEDIYKEEEEEEEVGDNRVRNALRSHEAFLTKRA